MIVKSTQYSLWLQCILFDNKLSIYLAFLPDSALKGREIERENNQKEIRTSLFSYEEITRPKKPSLVRYVLPGVTSKLASFCKCPSPKLTLKGGYCQTMPIVTKPKKIVALIELYTEQFTSSFIIVIKSSS